MTEVTAAGPAGHPGAGRTARRGRGPAPLLAATGCLPDGTPFYAPVGEVVTSGDLVVCHLCGRAAAIGDRPSARAPLDEG